MHIEEIHHALDISGVHTEVSSWKVEKNKHTSGAQVDLVIDRKDGIFHLCEAKFSNKPLLTTDKMAIDWANKRTLFEHATQTRKAVVTTLFASYPAHQNQHYNNEVHSELGIDDLFSAKK